MIAGELITSATVRTVLVAGMPRILPSRPSRANAARRARIRQRSPARDTAAHVVRVVGVTRRRDSQRGEPAHHVRAIAGQRPCRWPTPRPCSMPGCGRTGSSRASRSGSSAPGAGRQPAAMRAPAVATAATPPDRQRRRLAPRPPHGRPALEEQAADADRHEGGDGGADDPRRRRGGAVVALLGLQRRAGQLVVSVVVVASVVVVVASVGGGGGVRVGARGSGAAPGCPPRPRSPPPDPGHLTVGRLLDRREQHLPGRRRELRRRR